MRTHTLQLPSVPLLLLVSQLPMALPYLSTMMSSLKHLAKTSRTKQCESKVVAAVDMQLKDQV